MSTTLTPLRYPGGKSSYADLLGEIILLNNLHDVTLVEPFAGGAGASIKLLLNNRVSRLILNDLDPAIYAFWWAIKFRGKEFASKILRCEVSVKEWRRQRAIYNAKSTANLFELGFAAFYMNRCNRSGILTANPIGGIGQQGDYKIDARFNREGLAQKVLKIAERASQIDLRNGSCEHLIVGLMRRKQQDELLVYFDPPYFQKGPSLYMNHYKEADHMRLAEKIRRCRFNWILSYDCHETIRNLYRDVPLYHSELRYTILGNSKASELIATHLRMPVGYQSFQGDLQ